jgi:HK97 family phage major capsid protein
VKAAIDRDPDRAKALGLDSPTDASSIYLYEAREVVAVRRTDARLEISADAYFDSDQSAVRGIVRFDLVVLNPKAVVRITGIVP